ncbi:MAG: BMP family ABC transporter substrate-binding protein [Burkholderiaceae bacterium]|jgi:basic membrane protein A|nr:BMP family ABC transporter substrate-binding protein [Burkholderiaceae bacterium]
MRATKPFLSLALASCLLAACSKQEAPPAPKAEAPKAAAAATEPLKIGFVYVSPASDAGWTAQHHAGRGEMLQALGSKVTSTFVENVPEGADAERVIRDLAQQGNRLIFTTSFGFMNPTLKVAEEFRDVKFEHATGYKTAPNVNTYSARFYEGRYLAGMIAGRMTKTGTLGYVAAFPIPEVLQGINAFTLGARSVNPRVQVRVVWVNTWYDPGKERDAANALMGQGADVVTHHTDSTATVAAAEEKGKMAVAYHSNMAKFGPHAQLVAVTHHWGEYYTKRAQAVLDGTWKVEPVWGGIREGMIRLEGLSDQVPKNVVDEVKAREDEFRKGAFHPFGGPLRSNDGKVVHDSGPMSDEQLWKMDYYVEGVIGKVPAGK